MLALLAFCDRARFELHGISIGSGEGGPARQQLAEAFDHFHDANLLSDRDVIALMRELSIDIAVDLTGHTQEGRPGIFCRAGPVRQCRRLVWLSGHHRFTLHRLYSGRCRGGAVQPSGLLQ